MESARRALILPTNTGLEAMVDIGLRYFRRRKAACAVAVLTMALALGANTAAFSVVRAFLLSGLGVPRPDRLYVIAPVRELPGRGTVVFADAYPNYELLRQTQRTFAEVSCTIQGTVAWEDDGEPRPLQFARVTASFFATVGVQPMLGRAFRPDEEGPNPEAVVIVSYALWRGALAGDSAVVGQTLRIGGAPHTVLGVMPPRFEQPVPASDIWLPFDIPQQMRTAITGARQLSILGRLKDDHTHPDALREAREFTQRALDASVENRDYRYEAQTLRDNLMGGADNVILLVQAGAGVVLLLAIANLASLLVAWSVDRRQELALRQALGAGSGRVAWLLVAQSLAVVGAGAVIGCGLAFGALPFIRQFNPNPAFAFFMQQLSLDTTVLLVSAALGAVAGLLAGLLPAWLGRRADLARTLGGSARGSTLSRPSLRWQQAMVLVQAGLSVVILVAAALVGVSFRNLSVVPSGFDPAERVVLRVQLPERTYASHQSRTVFARALLEQFEREPALLNAGFSTTIPVGDVPNGGRFHVELPDGSITEEAQLLNFRRVSPNYFQAIGIPLIRGRVFDAHDDTVSTLVAIVSRAVAARLWPDEDPVGRKLYRAIGGGTQRQALEVVGIAGNVQDAGFRAPAGEAVYVPFAQISFGRLSIVARGRAGSDAAAAAVRRALKAADPMVAAGAEVPLRELITQANALPRLQTALLGAFAIVAIALVALGCYGTMSQLVASREREFALRLVVGAAPATLGRAVLLQLARLTVPGVLAGLAVAWWLGGSLQAFVFGVDPRSAVVLALVGGGVLVLAAVAALPQAIRAMHVDVRRSIAG